MSQNLKKITISASDKIDRVLSLTLFGGFLIILSIIFALIPIQFIYKIFLIGILLIPSIAILISIPLIPLIKISFTISKEGIKYIHKTRYIKIFQIRWSDFEKIELFRIKHWGGYGNLFKIISYRFKFIGPNVSKTFTLITPSKHIKKKKMILDALRYYTKKMNKELVEIPEIVKEKAYTFFMKYQHEDDFNQSNLNT